MDETLIKAIMESVENDHTMLKAISQLIDRTNDIYDRQEKIMEALAYLTGKQQI